MRLTCLSASSSGIEISHAISAAANEAAMIDSSQRPARRSMVKIVSGGLFMLSDDDGKDSPQSPLLTSATAEAFARNWHLHQRRWTESRSEAQARDEPDMR